MSFCQNCGNQLAEGTKFCQTCGKPVGSAAVQPAAQQVNSNLQQRGRVHCPNCKSCNLTVTTESSVSGGITTHHGGVSATRMSSTHRNYWICSDCGTKFRNIQSLEEEIAKSKKSRTTLFVTGAILLVLFLAVLINNAAGFFAIPYLIGMGIATLVCLIGGLSATKSIKNCLTELEYLKVNCFN